MKHKRLKTYLKLGILLFGIFAIVIACQKDDTIAKEQNANQTVPKIETISYEDSKNTIFNNLKAKYNLDNHKASRFSNNIQAKSTMDTLGLIIETDIIKQVTLGNYTSYTMKIVDNDSTVFYNLTIEYKDGSSDLFVTKYTPSDYWLNNKNEVYDGEVQSKRIDEFTYYSEVDDIFDETAIPNGEPGGPDSGSGTGGGSFNPNYSPYYPTDCNGIVLVTYEDDPYPCGCGDWPWDNCQGCTSSSPQWPGWNQIPMYYCQEGPDQDDDDPSDPVDTNGPGGQDPDPIPDDPAITVTIKPEECLERIPGDIDGDCQLDTYESCLLQGNSLEICDCVIETNDLEECYSRRQCNKINDLLNNYPSFRQDLIDLSNTVGEDHENAKGVFSDGTDFDVSGTAQNPYVNLNLNPVSMYITIAHTHYETATTPGQDTYSVFSPGDLEFYAQRLRENELDSNQFVAFLITGKGTRYALTISNKNKFLSFFSYVETQLKWYNGQAATQEEIEYYQNEIVPLYDKYFDRAGSNPAPINVKNVNNNMVLQEFLKFMDEANMGTELYEADETFTNFTQVKYDDNEPNNIKEKPCDN